MNKILRAILKVRFNENHQPLMEINEMYKDLNVLKFDDVYCYFLIAFISKNVINKNTDIYNQYFYVLMPNHAHETRHYLSFNIPSVRLEIEKSFVIYQTVKLINELKNNFDIDQLSKFSFKKKYLKFCIDNY